MIGAVFHNIISDAPNLCTAVGGNQNKESRAKTSSTCVCVDGGEGVIDLRLIIVEICFLGIYIYKVVVSVCLFGCLFVCQIITQ